MKKLLFPRFLRWKWLRVSSRDNSRTPFQWEPNTGAGFSTASSTARPWLGINANHDKLNYKSQADDPGSVLSYYKKMIHLRASSEVLKYGSFNPLLSTDALLMYSRESAQNATEGEAAASSQSATAEKAYIAAFNFSPRRIKLNQEAQILLRGKLAASNIGRSEWEPGQTHLEAWEAVVLRVP